ncbi:hypothetical protein JG687_00017676 [Phytophthora cactorum]|uniref:Uncharacterized protein n=1 Tax=Phytophthora cactorum TaxID=29920 RepID=A0A8T1TMG3_9STRA|nr:hypothetical protein JG687_00017676 [Phytophthora cactorum]
METLCGHSKPASLGSCSEEQKTTNLAERNTVFSTARRTRCSVQCELHDGLGEEPRKYVHQLMSQLSNCSRRRAYPQE